MKSSKLIPVLVSVNLVLAGVAVWQRLGKSSGEATEAPSGTTSRETADEASVSSSSATGSLVVEKAGFSYRDLLSTDLRKYIERLRAVECPEPTVQDIILAEVDRRFAAREAALALHRHQQNPWDPAPPNGGRSWAKWNQLRELRTEKQALVKELLGIDIPLGLPNWTNDRDGSFEAAMALIPEAKRQAARELLEKFRDQRRELQEKTFGYFLPEDAEAYLRNTRERRQELEKLLGKETLEDFEIAASQTGIALRSRFDGFELTDAERRSIFRTQLAADELQVPGTVVGRSVEAGEEANRLATAAQLQAQQEVASVRGAMTPERQAEFDRFQDPAYRNLVQQLNRTGLPRETALQVYEFSRGIRNELNAVLTQPGVDPAQRQALVQQFRADAEQRLKEMVGEEAFRQLGGGGRILRIPNLPSPQSMSPELLNRYGITPRP
jgi:hypothetical protein